MAMMMTGRVLLVCALCVLWCGAGCGSCDETTPESLDTGTDVSRGGQDPKSIDNTVHGTGGSVPTDINSESQAQAPQVPEVTRAAAGLTTNSSLALQSGEQASAPLQPTAEENKDQKTKEENEEEEEEVEEIKEDEDGEVELDDTGATMELSAAGQEQTSLPSGAERAWNTTKIESTQKTGDNDAAADGAGTREGKQNENKEATLKETPVESTAIKTQRRRLA
ncbi:trans-sialidase, putative, partial [Trypanosoma cruzi marinkellei]